MALLQQGETSYEMEQYGQASPGGGPPDSSRPAGPIAPVPVAAEPTTLAALATNVAVLVGKNIRLKDRSYRKLCCCCRCPCLFLMEFVVPPLLVLLLTMVKNDYAPSIVTVTGWGGDPQ